MKSKFTKLEQSAEVFREMLKKSIQVNGIGDEETIALSQKLDVHILKIQKLKVLENTITENDFLNQSSWNS